MKNLKRTIAIVCGGDSSEHGVSLRSAQGLYSFFDKDRYDVYVVVVKGLDWHVNLPDGTTVPVDRNDFSFMDDGKFVQFDYAYITIHGTPGENGIMQGYFEIVHVPYSTSGVLVEALTFNKFVLNQYLRGYGVRVADSLLIRKGYEEIVSDDEIEERITSWWSSSLRVRRFQSAAPRHTTRASYCLPQRLLHSMNSSITTLSTTARYRR